MKYTDENGANERNRTFQQAFVNASSICIVVSSSMVPYQRFHVQVALQMGDKVGQFVSDGEIHGKHVWCGFMQSLVYPLVCTF